MQTCLQCGKEFEGRKNKKFCSISCKNAYHNDKIRSEEEHLNEVNKVLHKNWKTLAHLFHVYKSAPFSIEVAKAQGLNTQFFTHLYNSPRGDKYVMVYDYGFLKQLDDQIRIVQMDVEI